MQFRFEFTKPLTSAEHSADSQTIWELVLICNSGPVETLLCLGDNQAHLAKDLIFYFHSKA